MKKRTKIAIELWLDFPTDCFDLFLLAYPQKPSLSIAKYQF